MKRILQLIVLLLLASGSTLHAQTPLFTDGLMMPKKDLGVGLYYGNSAWKKYWEGSLKRDNGNVGTVTTQSATLMAAYGLNEKTTVVATLPYVWTKASGGTLRSMEGVQDLTVGLKYNFLRADFGNNSLRFFALGSLSTPMTHYSADFMPLSIGSATTNLSGRLTATYIYNTVWFATLSGAYTWRSNLKLDRPAYYTNGQLYLTNEVQMPNVFDFIGRIGYHKNAWRLEVYSMNQNTLGGGDIRRQDMPFVSNRMNYFKAGASVMFAAPNIDHFAFRVWGDYVLAGRNVGQSYSAMAGVMYFFRFAKPQ